MGIFVNLSGDVPILQKVFFRNIVTMLIAFTIIRRDSSVKNPFGNRKNRYKLLFRSLFGLAGVAFYFYALSNMYVADAAMLNKLSPFFVAIFATFFLGEKLSRFHVPVLLLAFISAMFIIRPKFDVSVLPAVAGALSAACAAAAYTTIRFIGNREPASVVVFFFSFVTVAALFPFVIVDWSILSFEAFVYLILIGVSAGVGQMGLTHAYRCAPAAEISIYSYATIIFSMFLAFIFFDSLPAAASLIGGAGIILSAFLIRILSKHGKSAAARQ